MFGFSYVKQLSTEGEDAEIVASNDTKTSNCESLGRVSLCQDERTPVSFLCSSIVGVS